MLLNSFFKIQTVSPIAEGIVAHVSLNSEHEIYKAHFPGQPITPGVCQIQMVTEILMQYLNKPLELTDIKNVKYMAVITPMEVPELDVRILKIMEVDGDYKASVVLAGTDQVFSKMSLTYHVVCHHSDL